MVRVRLLSLLNKLIEVMQGVEFEGDASRWYVEVMDALDAQGVLTSSKLLKNGVFRLELRNNNEHLNVRGVLRAIIKGITLGGEVKKRELVLRGDINVATIMSVGGCDVLADLKVREGDVVEVHRVPLYVGRGYVVFIDRYVRPDRLGRFLWVSWRGFGAVLVPPGVISGWRVGDDGLVVVVDGVEYLITFPRLSVYSVKT